MHVAMGQINTVQGDLAGNAKRILAVAREARREGAELLLVPELALAGYCPRDLVYRASFLEAAAREEARLAAAIPDGLHVLAGTVAPGGPGGGKPHNGAVLLGEGKVRARFSKQLLPNYDVFDEARWFAPGEPAQPFQLGGRRFGVTICEDIWSHAEATDPGMPTYRRDPPAEQVRRGADVLLNLSASPFDWGKPARRERLVRDVARRSGVPVLLVNLVGGNDELIFDGHSVVSDAQGRVVARAAGFDEHLLLVDLDDLSPLSVPPLPERSLEEIRKALTLGLVDYARKSGFRRALVGLSGGIDSALTAALAVDALGAQNILGVSMPSRYTSDLSRTEAKALATTLGIRLETIPIVSANASVLSTLQPHFEGRPPDVTEENIQARLRGMFLMALSNKLGHLLLTTGNKSELAVGYSTLYGDLCGGLAVISDLPKTQVYALARHLNTRRPGTIPEPTLTRPPSAELRPDQKDEDSLPPYDVLDDIIYRSMEKLESFAEITAAGHDPVVVKDVLQRLWRNEYKRRQMPPGLKVTSKAFGTGRRMPITGAPQWYEIGE